MNQRARQREPKCPQCGDTGSYLEWDHYGIDPVHRICHADGCHVGCVLEREPCGAIACPLDGCAICGQSAEILAPEPLCASCWVREREREEARDEEDCGYRTDAAAASDREAAH